MAICPQKAHNLDTAGTSDQRQNCEKTSQFKKKGHANSEGGPRYIYTQAKFCDDGRATESKYNELSNRWLAPRENNGDDVHKVTTDTEDASRITHKDDVDESQQMWYFDNASNLHVTG